LFNIAKEKNDSFLRDPNNTSNLHEKDTALQVDIKDFLSGVTQDALSHKDISFLDANLSAIDPGFLYDDDKNNDIILCISNLDFKDFDDNIATQSEKQLVKKISLPSTKAQERITTKDLETNDRHVIQNRRYKRLIIALLVLLLLIVCGIIFHIFISL
jgi:hypothetical protein